MKFYSFRKEWEIENFIRTQMKLKKLLYTSKHQTRKINEYPVYHTYMLILTTFFKMLFSVGISVKVGFKKS